jgi:aryl-alcohol dehydrogenase-like predicted oxidoreductase
MGGTMEGLAMQATNGGAAATQAIPRRPLGKTGEEVSILCLGGAHLGKKPSAAEATRIVQAAIDGGIDFMDNAWEYNEHESERRMGAALAEGGYRQRAFLMTKNCAHDRKADNSMVKLEESLKRLKTDYLDLWQIHEVVWPDDPDRIFAAGGAAEAMLKAKEQGKVRYIGFTGHKDPAIFERMLAQGFPWDTLQMPVNALDAHFQSFQARILPIAQAQGIGVIGMKSLAGGHLLKGTELTPQEAIGYALSQPIASLCVGVDSMEVLEQDLAIGRGFAPLPAEEQARILAKAAPHAPGGRFEPFKSSHDFEGDEARKEHGLPLRAAD